MADMRMEDLDLDVQYQKARISLSEDLEAEHDLFMDEVGIPAVSVKCVDEWVRVKFDGRSKATYVIETNLGLYSPDNTRFGYYCLHEDQDGNIVDDFLVFE